MNNNKIFESLKTINFWYEKPNFNLGFIRQSYFNDIYKSLNNKLVKVLVGQRRTGKSYIVRQIITKLIEEHNVNPENIFYLNKEMFEFDEISDANSLYEIIKYYEKIVKPKGKIYLFIDEIQDINKWEKVIASVAQHATKDYEVFITGSNSKLLSGELSTKLSGRYIQFNIFPFSYYEYIKYYNLINNKESFIKYITSSALPETFNINNTDIIRHYFQSLKNTVLLKDIISRFNIRDHKLLEDLFLFLVHNIGSLTSIPSIIKYYKSKNRRLDYKTISQYIDYMRQAYLISEVPRSSIKTKEVLSGERKYFLTDIGFRNYLYPSLVNDFGNILENIAFKHLKKAGYNLKVGSASNLEIDFIAESHNTKKYFQIAYLMPEQKTIDREFGALEKINDNFEKIVLSMDDLLINNRNGIKHFQIWDYLYELG